MTVATILLYGYHPVREALRARRRRIDTLHLAQGKGIVRRQELVDLAEQAGVKVEWTTPDKLTVLVGHRRHQDVAAHATDYPASSLEEILAHPATEGQAPWVVMLDQVVDPQNFGAIVRTAHCAGVQGIVAPRDRSAPPTPAASKASAGALEHMR
ncbi:MAG: 23S rRNA (guanosine(2251)-2'-O)-methyltransferase RlmB, partial [Desulfatitalea sp.]|nr:23S rRNA (guanosine(2251)-2'-O)-methyltransferase RlmB [Desulfatitalea sp.]